MESWALKVMVLFERHGIHSTAQAKGRGVVEFSARCHPSEIPESVIDLLDLPETELLASIKIAGSGAWLTFDAPQPKPGGRSAIEAIAEGRAADRAIAKVMSRGHDKGSAIAILKSRKVICQNGRHLKRCSESIL